MEKDPCAVFWKVVKGMSSFNFDLSFDSDL